MNAATPSGTAPATPGLEVEVHDEGGLAYFPGLSRPLALDLSQLGAAETAELRQLIEAAGFFGLPARLGAVTRGAADQQRTVLSIGLDGRRHTVSVLRPAADEALRALLDRVQGLAKAQRSRLRQQSEPPGGA